MKEILKPEKPNRLERESFPKRIGKNPSAFNREAMKRSIRPLRDRELGMLLSLSNGKSKDIVEKELRTRHRGKLIIEL